MIISWVVIKSFQKLRRWLKLFLELRILILPASEVWDILIKKYFCISRKTIIYSSFSQKNVLVMFHDKISHQKRYWNVCFPLNHFFGFSDTKDNRKRRVKNKWILACRNVKIEQQEEEEERYLVKATFS